MSSKNFKKAIEMVDRLESKQHQALAAIGIDLARQRLGFGINAFSRQTILAAGANFEKWD